MTRTWTLFGLCTAAFFCASCQTSDQSEFRKLLPELSKGFHWEVFDSITVAVATPDGWQRTTSVRHGTYTGSLSPARRAENAADAADFTVQVLTGVKRFARLAPSELAIRIEHDIVAAPENKVLTRSPLKGRRSARSGFIRYRRAPDATDQTTIHKMFIADDARDLLYVYTFKSPSQTWDKMFQAYGEFMMQHIAMAR